MAYRSDTHEMKMFYAFMEQPDCGAWINCRDIIQKMLNESATLS
jgi:hypothetical protein